MTGMVNGFDNDRIDQLDARLRDQITRRNRVLGPGYRLLYDTPVEVVRGEGTYLFDSQGTRYLDAYNNVPSVGHAHPHVAAAVNRQMAQVNTNTRYLNEQVLDYAERLVATFPDQLGHVTFTCTGSEANDLAMRVATYVTGAQGVIVTENAYHGLTAAVAAFSPSLGEGSALGAHVRVVPAPDARRAPDGIDAYMRSNVAAAIADLRRHGIGLAAFIADSIFSSDGVFAHPTGFLAPVVDEVHKAGGLYVADEVQPGFGRTGDGMWGFTRHGIVPDIVTIGKPMGNGLPIAAAVFKPELLSEFGRNIRYFNTFGGNTVSIAAAGAVLDVIENEGLIDNAHDVGARLVAGIETVAADVPEVTQVRGAGLFIGVETTEPGFAAAIVNELRRRRVLISLSGAGNVLKVRPPLAFRAADAELFLQEFAAATSEIQRTTSR